MSSEPNIGDYFEWDKDKGFIHKVKILIKDIPKEIFENAPDNTKFNFIEKEINNYDFKDYNLKNIFIIFHNCKISGIKIKAINCSFIFTNYKIENGIGHLDIQYENVSNSIQIQNSVISDFYLNKLNLEKFYIINSKIKRLKLDNECIIKEFDIQDSVNSNSEIDIIEFDNSIISSIIINRLKNCRTINFNKVESNKINIFFSDVERILFPNYNTNELIIVNGKISLVDIYIENEIEIESIKTSINIKNIFRSFDFININSGYLNELIINSTEFNSFEKVIIKCYKVNLKTLSTKLLKLNGNFKEESKIINCKISNLEFNGFDSVKNFKFENLNVFDNIPSFKIENSTQINIILSPSFLHKFKSIEISNSSFQGITLNNFELIEPKIIIGSEMDHQQKIDFVRELNGLMLANHHKHYYTIYRALEQDLRLKKDNTLRGFDRFIVTLNSLSNSHGTKPQKAFGWFVVIFFIHIVCVGIDLIYLNASFDAVEFFGNYYSYYFKPLTFISELDFKEKLNLKNQFEFSGWIKAMDFVYKLVYAYLLYQFIAAFRKFNK